MSAVSAVKKLVLFSPYAFAFFLLIAFAGLGALYGSVFSPASAAPLVGAGVGVLVGIMVAVGLTEIDEETH